MQSALLLMISGARERKRDDEKRKSGGGKGDVSKAEKEDSFISCLDKAKDKNRIS